MAILATDTGGSFKHAPTGSHMARCYQVIQLGHQKSEYQGEVNINNQILVSWELPNEERLEDGRPMSISKFYTLSLHEKSNLGKDLVMWRGREFTEKEKEGFDITKLVCVPAMLSIVEKNSKSKVGGVSSIPKGMKCPEGINAPVIFELEAYIKGDNTVFDTLPDGIKKMILRAEEFKDSTEHSEIDPPHEFHDDIPF